MLRQRHEMKKVVFHSLVRIRSVQDVYEQGDQNSCRTPINSAHMDEIAWMATRSPRGPDYCERSDDPRAERLRPRRLAQGDKHRPNHSSHRQGHTWRLSIKYKNLSMLAGSIGAQIGPRGAVISGDEGRNCTQTSNDATLLYRTYFD